MSDNSKNANISTLILMVLKDIRNERGVHQGHLAKSVGKSPSAWSKIENGQSQLTADVMIGACWALQLYPSYIMSIIERMTPMFNNNGYYFHTTGLEEGEDELLPLVISYFTSKGYEAMKANPFSRISITNIFNGTSIETTPTIIRYCCEPSFRDWIDEGAKIGQSAFINPGIGLSGLTTSAPIDGFTAFSTTPRN
ncbi:XRE family transcriptional regulator [Pectobacterium polaris]|uniref:helix-turn-helix domain-containing protein n=1 Tax=Pectobacterium polaris TaxID=2042057 RepID=UPI000D605DCC|nr:helix-turn-helix transcriptional regulator [Pectobacterium polaris]MCU1791096.1 XRE family transcriptional regulator [Pectobacterium polaris]PWD62178.1 XRE family transcriptional regulator [Pectobacterium polaris]